MVRCTSCGFDGDEEDFDAAVKQELVGNAMYTNVGFCCRRCGKEFW